MSDPWLPEDYRYMAQAIQLAKRGLYTTDPNPRVGCLLVKDGSVVGQGWHVKAGEGHAEVNALADAGEQARGATAYVTLEPCSHYGRTPPCSDALIKAGIARCVVAMQDPNPMVAGRGFQMLTNAGISVSFGLLQSEAEALNPGFIRRMRTGLPYVRIKMAISVDGRTAMSSGESQWITGPAARLDVQRLRARSSAILSGIETIQADDAALTVRSEELGMEYSDQTVAQQPLRVILDTQAKLSEDARLLASGGEILWVVGVSASVCDRVKANHRVSILRVDQSVVDQRDLGPILKALSERGINELLVEAGATVAGSFISQACWDELVIYMAPKLMGSSARPLAALSLDQMSDASDLALVDLRQIGNDIRMIYVPQAS